MQNKQNLFFRYKGKNYFGRPNGCAVQYMASEWEEGAEIEFGTTRYGFNGMAAEDCIYLEFDLMKLEAQCLCYLAREMQTRIRANFDGEYIEIEPWENIATVKKEIQRLLFEPKHIPSFMEKINAIFA